MKVLAENINMVVPPLESITINLDPEELEYITRAVGKCVPPSPRSFGDDLYSKLNDLCKKYKLDKYTVRGSTEIRFK